MSAVAGSIDLYTVPSAYDTAEKQQAYVENFLQAAGEDWIMADNIIVSDHRSKGRGGYADYWVWGVSELIAELERRDNAAMQAFKTGTPLQGTTTCMWCGKDVIADNEGYCPECQAFPTS